MTEYATYTTEQCLKQETLFLVIVRQEGTWVSGRKEPTGSIVKVDLRPYGRGNSSFSYCMDEYREASGSEKLLVYSGKRDVIIWRNR